MFLLKGGLLMGRKKDVLLVARGKSLAEVPAMDLVKCRMGMEVEDIGLVRGYLQRFTGGILAVNRRDNSREDWVITHTPTGLGLPGNFKTKKAAETATRNLWDNLTTEQRECWKSNVVSDVVDSLPSGGSSYVRKIMSATKAELLKEHLLEAAGGKR
jgi:hypothetical protein